MTIPRFQNQQTSKRLTFVSYCKDFVLIRLKWQWFTKDLLKQLFVNNASIRRTILMNVNGDTFLKVIKAQTFEIITRKAKKHFLKIIKLTTVS